MEYMGDGIAVIKGGHSLVCEHSEPHVRPATASIVGLATPDVARERSPAQRNGDGRWLIVNDFKNAMGNTDRTLRNGIATPVFSYRGTLVGLSMPVLGGLASKEPNGKQRWMRPMLLFIASFRSHSAPVVRGW